MGASAWEGSGNGGFEGLETHQALCGEAGVCGILRLLADYIKGQLKRRSGSPVPTWVDPPGRTEPQEQR